MKPVLFKCSNSGELIQFWCDGTLRDQHIYEAVRCPSCGRAHLINKNKASRYRAGAEGGFRLGASALWGLRPAGPSGPQSSRNLRATPALTIAVLEIGISE